MPAVQGRLLVWETGASLGNLVVELYDADPQSYPAFETGELIGKRPTALRALPLRRLGSAISDRDGQFTIQYPGDDRSPANLALVVVAPEIAGANGASKILHASCAIRESPGDTEQYVIALAKSALRDSGALPLALVRTTPMQDVANQLDKVRKGRRQRSAEQQMSTVYRRKVRKLARSPDRGPDRGFRLAIPTSGLGGKVPPPAFQDGKWVTRTRDGHVGDALDIVVVPDKQPAVQRPSGPIRVRVDRKNRKLRIAVSRAEPPLLMAQEGPGELVVDRVRRRHPPGAPGSADGSGGDAQMRSTRGARHEREARRPRKVRAGAGRRGARSPRSGAR